MSWLRDIHMCRDKRARMLLTQKTKRNINVRRKLDPTVPSFVPSSTARADVLVPIQEYPTYILLTVERLILILYLWSKFNAVLHIEYVKWHIIYIFYPSICLCLWNLPRSPWVWVVGHIVIHEHIHSSVRQYCVINTSSYFTESKNHISHNVITWLE
jgi:hypothetical protein